MMQLTPPEFDFTADPFLAFNQETFEQVVTFVDFVPERFALGFISVNFARDRDRLLQALQKHPRCQDIHFNILQFADRNLRFLRDRLLAELPQHPFQLNKKRVLVITGLEHAIGMIGDYPMLLQDLNYVRDAFTTSVPYPILICLPNVALTRLAKYAPDFWAWRLAVFQFYTLPTTVDQVMGRVFQKESLPSSLKTTDRQAYINLMLSLLAELTAKGQAKALDDCRTHADLLNQIGEVYYIQGELELATQAFQESVKLAATLPADSTKAFALRYLGVIQSDKGELEAAFPLFCKSLEIQESISDLQGQATTLSSLAKITAQQGNVESALGLWQKALNIQERIVDVQGRATTLSNMANVIAQQGDIDHALRLWQEALDIEEEIGDIQGKAMTLDNMAGVIAQGGDIDLALALRKQSLSIQEQIGDAKGKAATLNNMASVVAQQGDIERALQLWQDSLDIKERINDVQGKAATLNNMAGVIAAQGEIERAMQLWVESLEFLERINDVRGKATTLNNMARVIAEQGEVERAMQLWAESLELYERINDVQGKATTLNNMAGVIVAQGEVERAMQLWAESLELYERINDVQGKATTLNNMARVIAEQGEIERAMQLWAESLELLERINDVRGKAATLANMAYVAGESGDKPRQLDLNLQAALAFASARAYVDLFTVLTNLGVTAEVNSQTYLAQALWLGLRVTAPFSDLINLLSFWFNQVPQGDEMEALLATTALFLCQLRGQGHPQLEKMFDQSFMMLLFAAETQGVKFQSQEELTNWMEQQQLNDPEQFLPRLNQRLGELVGDQWLFDRSLFES